LAIVSRAEDRHERVRANTRQGMTSVREEGGAVDLIPSSPAVHLAVAFSYATTASGRKRPVIFRISVRSELPLLAKADVDNDSLRESSEEIEMQR